MGTSRFQMASAGILKGLTWNWRSVGIQRRLFLMNRTNVMKAKDKIRSAWVLKGLTWNWRSLFDEPYDYEES